MIRNNIQSVRERVAAAAARSGRAAAEITLVGVTKTVSVIAMREAAGCGLTDLGENRVQEAREKIESFNTAERKSVRWHLIGHLQTNKVKLAVDLFDMIHSVDSFKLASEISRRAATSGRPMQVLVQVNTSGEDSKFGVLPEEALDLVSRMSELPSVEIVGLMTIGSLEASVSDNRDDARKSFALLRNIRDEIDRSRIDGVEMKYLSMGMTNDFEIAIEEGSNVVRIGSAIFGSRK